MRFYIYYSLESLHLQDALDGIEFARGSPKSKWGSLRADMGHPHPFDLRYVAIGNEDCEMFNYQGMPFYLFLFLTLSLFFFEN